MVWKSGVSGNPKGRRSGESPTVRERFAKHGEDVAQMVIDAALGGDMTAARIIIDRLSPPLKQVASPVKIHMPANITLAEQAGIVLRHASEGLISPDQALQLVSGIANLSRIIEVDELEKRLTALEEKNDQRIQITN